MNYIEAIILGVVEGVTEFLPVSSTGHLILAAHILKLPPTGFLKSFEISIQLGAILSVIVLYRRVIFTNIAVAKRILVAFFPTALSGAIFYKFVKNFLLANTLVVLAALFLGGLFLIAFEAGHKEQKNAPTDLSLISYPQACAIGIFQSVALIPGISRSAATIIGGLGMGLERKTIVEFSFLLAVPTLLAATAWDMIQSRASFSGKEFMLLLAGFVVSFMVAALVIKAFLRFIEDNNFFLFGIYRILLAFAFWILVINK